MRLFVALLLDDSVRAALSRMQKKLASSCDGVRWVGVEQLHLTVKFLDDVPDANVKRVTDAVADSVSQCNAFTMTLADCGCFPPRGPVRITWSGVNDSSGAMTQCVNKVISTLEQIGFDSEKRDWSPHITIGRIRDDRSHGAIRTAVEAFSFEAIQQSVKSISVMSSVLSTRGPTYTAINTTDLRNE